jgi:hypothetical protein
MEAYYQAVKVLQALLKAGGGWVSKAYLARTLGPTQAGARIFELENELHWPIEHSTFTDEFGFRSYRLFVSTRQFTLPNG